MNGAPKKSAALQALEKVKDAEARARRIVREAQEKISAQIIKDASEESERIKQDHLVRVKEAAEAKKKAVLAAALKEAEKIGIRAETEAAALRQKAAASKAEAVKKVTRRIKELLEGGFV
jgi:vacuolar-type H+-ATPase subunit H